MPPFLKRDRRQTPPVRAHETHARLFPARPACESEAVGVVGVAVGVGVPCPEQARNALALAAFGGGGGFSHSGAALCSFADVEAQNRFFSSIERA
jgi:hypothetical protein